VVATARKEGLLVHVTGVVQGVGFRPFVHRLALRHALAGWVRNESGDVRIALEGDARDLEAFLRDLRADAPPLSRIEEVRSEPRAPGGAAAFVIEECGPATAARQPIPADVALCPACEAELHDPADRRYRYPFITCTDCGPRYTVIEGLPYDRERTSMRAFAQCPACASEYATPGNRRHHSETNSCPACGPRLWLERRSHPDPERSDGEGSGPGAPVRGHPERSEGSGPGAPWPDPSAAPQDDILGEAAALLRDGQILALRGLGGFHLAVDATNAAAVQRLRARKRREEKPFAVMVRTTADAAAIADLSPADCAQLEARERPIVLLPKRAGGALAPAVAPGLGSVGVMLAYTPLHHLLLDLVQRPLVMTSGNLSDEPIAASLEEGRERLGAIADAFLMHDREIVAMIDDSVVRVAASASGPGGDRIVMRRARGLAPLPLRLHAPAPAPILAVGGHLKNTFTFALGERAFVSPHVGDLDSLETLTHFRAILDDYRRLFRAEPAVIARDLHPGYLSTRLAEELAGELGVAQVVSVQHHHAHIAAVAAEHGVDGPVLGLSFDGTGYGDDGRVWGAELLYAEPSGYRRLGHLRYAPLPGGDLAVRSPWRAALGYCSLEPSVAPAFDGVFDMVDAQERAAAERQLARAVNAPLASSAGRLFDAAAAVLGVRTRAHYEGQAAMELESLAGGCPAAPLPFPVVERPGGMLELDPIPLLVALAEGRRAGQPLVQLAAAFHESVALGAAVQVQCAAERTGIDTVALGGGVFQNARLVTSLATLLRARGFRVLTARELPPNDGGLSFGQAVVAAAVLRGLPPT
jgi:hydrogenase maturation protein HypF